MSLLLVRGALDLMKMKIIWHTLSVNCKEYGVSAGKGAAIVFYVGPNLKANMVVRLSNQS